MVPYAEVPARIKEALLLSQRVEASGIALKKQGREWVGLCPFHDEKTPSFSVNDAKGVYLCRGCGAKGDVINFHASMLSITPGDAIKALAKECGITIEPPQKGQARQRPATPQPRTSWSDSTLKSIAQAASELFVSYGHTSEEFAQVIADRSITTLSVHAYALGFYPVSAPFVEDLAQSPRLSGLSIDQVRAGCRELGLVHRHNDTSPFEGRLIFPITNTGGEVVAFSGRSLDDAQRPKYRNSPESQIFDKSTILYGLAPIKAAVSESPELRHFWQRLVRQDTLYLVEGYTDVIALAQRGLFAVAAMGTGLSQRQARLALRHARHVICLYDGDAAGRKAMTRSLLALFPLLDDAHRLYGLSLPDGDDPDSFLGNVTGDPASTLQTLPRTQPESVWWRHHVGTISRPPALCDQVLIERAWAAQDSYPSTPLWRQVLARRIQHVAGYRVRDPHHLVDLPPWYRSHNAGISPAIDDPALLLWLARFRADPDTMMPLVSAMLPRWWVSDLLHGRLQEGVPEGSTLLFAASWCLKGQDIDNWRQCMALLLEQGFPAHWLKSWLDVRNPVTGDLAPDHQTLRFEWEAWVGSLDETLTNRLLHAVASADCAAETADAS
ncbi:MAG: DNA primase catalytic core [Marinobacter sp. T13-3]|nr:MAG: DNA primase catalytic core [Marinobacter sp. T13-3]